MTLKKRVVVPSMHLMYNTRFPLELLRSVRAAVGSVPEDTLYEALRDDCPALYRLGDAQGRGDFRAVSLPLRLRNRSESAERLQSRPAAMEYRKGRCRLARPFLCFVFKCPYACSPRRAAIYGPPSSHSSWGRVPHGRAHNCSSRFPLHNRAPCPRRGAVFHSQVRTRR